MPRGRYRRTNPLEIRVVALRIPKSRVSPLGYLRALLQAVDTETLPRGWQVELHWRNRETSAGRTAEWQNGPWSEVLADSNANGLGFSTALRRILQRKIQEVSAGR